MILRSALGTGVFAVVVMFMASRGRQDTTTGTVYMEEFIMHGKGRLNSC
jgi:hypothetical protein